MAKMDTFLFVFWIRFLSMLLGSQPSSSNPKYRDYAAESGLGFGKALPLSGYARLWHGSFVTRASGNAFRLHRAGAAA